MATKRKLGARAVCRKGRWVVDDVDERGKRTRKAPPGFHRTKTDQKVAAMKWAAEINSKRAAGTYSSDSAKVTFAELVSDYFATTVFKKLGTEKSYRASANNYLLPYFGPLKLSAIRVETVNQFRKELTEGYPPVIAEAIKQRWKEVGRSIPKAIRNRKRISNASINQHLRHLNVLFKHAMAKDWLGKNPATFTKKLPTQQRKVVLSLEEVNNVIDRLEGPPRDENGVLLAPSPNWDLLIRVAIFTGMREGEIIGLRWHDVHVSDSALHVAHTWNHGGYNAPKTDNGVRRVEVPADLMADLRTWRTELLNIGVSVEGHDPVFPTRKGKPQGATNLLKRGWYPALKRAGVYDAETKEGKHCRFHDLRHTAVSLMKDLGVSEGDIIATTGHSMATMRAVYSHPIPKERRGGTDAIAAAIAGHRLGNLKKKA